MTPEEIKMEDRIMRLLVELQDYKMRLVKEQNFTDAQIIREAQNILRLVVGKQTKS